MMMRTAIAAAALMAALCAPAAAQTPGALNWSGLGFADEAAITSGATQASAGVTTTVAWSIATDGGSFIAYAGNDFVSYESGVQGGFTGYAQVGFDNARQDADDRVTIDIGFSEAVQNVAFTLTDVDQNAWDDFVEIFYDTGSGYVNARTGAFTTFVGPDVAVDNESFGDGWEGLGSAASTETDGNLAFNFGILKVISIRIVYFSGNDAGGGGFDPQGQQLGVSNIAFTKLAPLISVVKSVGNLAAGAFNTPGQEVVYTIAVANSGDGTVDADGLFLVDRLPTELEFFNGDFDGAGPGTGAVGFSQSGAGLTFAPATDVRYSSAVAAPASFAACTYTPAAGYDPAVRHLCFNPKGSMNAGTPASVSFSLSFRSRIR